jgi:predicted Zn finger-like uncharacterized protein
MPIAVVCPGCQTQFRVSEKYAGKKGPCPKCKAVITIPTASAVPEVKIHEPEQFASGGKDATGKLVTKPIPRPKVRFKPKLAAAAAVAVVVVLLVAWLLRAQFAAIVPLQLAGLLAVSPPLVIAGYLFLRSDEDLQPYRGRVLWIRAAVCTAVYVALWIGFELIPRDLLTEYWSLAYVVPPFLIAGAVAALASLDLDFGSAFFHYCFYVLATIGLRLAAGVALEVGPAA